MKIISCYIENFGSLHHMKCSLNDGLNSLNEKNGWGKSTFAVFLRAMFYGLESSKVSSKYDEKDYRKNLTPWQGGNFGGYVEFETSGKKYRVTRFFGEKQKDDSFDLLDLDSGALSDDFSENLGEELFGIDAYGYERSVYIPHNDLTTGTDDSVNARLLGFFESGGDMNNFEGAMKILNDARRELKKTGGRGKIDKESEEKAELEIRLKKAIESENETTAKKNELLEIVKEKDDLKNEREEAERELADLAQKNVTGGGRAVMMVFGIIFILLGLAAAGAGTYAIMYLPLYYFYGYIAAAAGGGLFILGVVLLIIRHIGVNMSKNEFAELQDRVTEKRKQFEAVFAKETDLKQEIDTLSRTNESPDVLRSEIARLEESGNADKEKLEAIERTMSVLSDARQSLSGHYMDKLKSNFAEYLSKAGIRNDGAVLDSSLNISLESYGNMHSVMSESSGIRDIIYLCARFALIDALFENDRPCVVIDDVMNNMDEDKFEKAMKMTEDFARKNQVIYLTCNASRMPVVK